VEESGTGRRDFAVLGSVTTRAPSTPGEGAAYPQHTSVQIDIGPAQRESLPTPQPSVDQEREQGRVSACLGSPQNPPDVLWLEVSSLLRATLGRVTAVATLRASASSRMAVSRIALSALNAERMVESDNPALEFDLLRFDVGWLEPVEGLSAELRRDDVLPGQRGIQALPLLAGR
jgi:hypothetical protein